MLKFVKQLTDFQYHRVSFAKCTQLERSPGKCQNFYDLIITIPQGFIYFAIESS